MSIVGDILSWPSRLRRAHGFGVHSPFAFNLIMETIRERGEYYAYEQLRQLPYFRRNSLIFRLICRFQPSKVTILGTDPAIEETVRLADSRVLAGRTPEPRPANAIEELLAIGTPIYIIADPAAVDPSTVDQIPAPAIILLCHPRRPAARVLWQRLCTRAHGYGFTTRNLSIYCHLPRLSHHVYELI